MAPNGHKQATQRDYPALEDVGLEEYFGSQSNRAALGVGFPEVLAGKGEPVVQSYTLHARGAGDLAAAGSGVLLDLSTPMPGGRAVFEVRPVSSVHSIIPSLDTRVFLEVEDCNAPCQISLSLRRLAPQHQDATGHGTDLERQFEKLYRRLCERSNAADIARSYFILNGELAAKWLVGRMRREHSLDRLDAAADALSRIGSAAVACVLDALERPQPPEVHTALLHALCWFSPETTCEVEGRVEAIVERFLHGADEETAEAAVSASRCLSVTSRRPLLERAYKTVRSDVVREAVADELKRP